MFKARVSEEELHVDNSDSGQRDSLGRIIMSQNCLLTSHQTQLFAENYKMCFFIVQQLHCRSTGWVL